MITLINETKICYLRKEDILHIEQGTSPSGSSLIITFKDHITKGRVEILEMSPKELHKKLIDGRYEELKKPFRRI